VKVKPKLLDLFCGAGGAAMGYYRAGFDIVGVDIKKQKQYPFQFFQGDALRFLETFGDEFDAIHASPPCHAYSTLKGLTKIEKPELIENVRSLLIGENKPWVIENVKGAPLINSIQLCGSSFGLGVRRHRLFELSFCAAEIPKCQHERQRYPIDVTGTGGSQKTPRKAPGGGLSRKPKNMRQASEAMGIYWMTRKEINQAIPPAYTEFIGKQLMEKV
jgi:DNA (cytosine-5)-methyltransferase 1